MNISSMHNCSFDGQSNARSNLTKVDSHNITSFRDRESHSGPTSEKGAAVAVAKKYDNESSTIYNQEENHRSRRFEEVTKHDQITDLRQRYNQMMKESLERKA